MLKIRMQRTGRTNAPSFRIVVLEHTASPKAGKFVEQVGTYNPKTKARTLDQDRVKYWLSVGAQASPTVHNMLVTQGVVSGKKINILPAYKAPAEAAADEAKEAAEKAAEQEAKAEAKAAHDAEVKAEAETKASEQQTANPENGSADGAGSEQKPEEAIASEAPKT